MININSEQTTIRKKNGVVYTPRGLASYVAAKTFRYFFRDVKGSFRNKKNSDVSINRVFSNLKIIDPSCGQGELLIAAWDVLSKAFPPSGHQFCDPERNLFGIDIDKHAIEKAKQRINSLPQIKTPLNGFNFVKTNALFPVGRNCPVSGWSYLKERFNVENGFDILIANPPWGADIESYRNKIAQGSFLLSRGQFDTSDLFIELALSIVVDGGYFAFIIPDSLFNKERTKLRKLLLDQTEIKFIGRFGEKFFENVNRACVVLICKKRKPSLLNKVDCLRLTPDLRKAVLEEKLQLSQIERQLVHKVSQDRFKKNKDYLFDIDLKEEEEALLGKIKMVPKTFRDYVFSSRGVELSKTGIVCRCRKCRLWSPLSKSDIAKCPHCGSLLDSSYSQTETIVASKLLPGYEPLLVGESIKRYEVVSSFWIAIDKEGINYKDKDIYRGSKILIRKTGVGLSASLDYTDSLTNQVVYILKMNNEKKNIPIESLLGILNSRLIYYYLTKNHGETEWRSHPYLTQNQILDLPLPDLEVPSTFKILKLIGSLLKPFLTKGQRVSRSIDAKVEFLISKFYRLSKRDYYSIYKTINDAEQLLPVRVLKDVSLNDIFDSKD